MRAHSTVLVTLLAAGLVLAGTPSGHAEPLASTGDQPHCVYRPDGTKPARPVPAPPATSYGKAFQATLVTNYGAVTFQALTRAAPCTTHNFRHLARHRFYNRTVCHRLVTERIYVLQCGDPSATGEGGPGYDFADENLSGATYPAGTVAMANAGPNTNGSQFFFTYADTKLRPNYTPFGRVVRGLDVLKRIAAAGTADGRPDGAPKVPVRIHRVLVHR